jgi:hypothetical protein
MWRLLSRIGWAFKIGTLPWKLPALLAGAAALIRGSWEYLHQAPALTVALGSLGLFAVVFLVTLLPLAYLATPEAGTFTPRYFRFYRWPLARLSWRFDNFLGGRAPPVLITSFQPAFRINRGQGIRPRKAYIWSPRTGERADVLIECGNPYVAADAIEFMPRGKWYQCQVHFGDVGLTKAEFLARFDGFDFVFQYDDTEFKRTFSRSEIELLFDSFERYATAPSEVRPTLKPSAPANPTAQ